MATTSYRRPCNGNWASGPNRPLSNTPLADDTAFDHICRDLRLSSPAQIVASNALRKWAKTNKNRRYIPEWLLDQWGLDALDDERGTL